MDLGAQVVAVEAVAIPEDICVPRRDSALSAWVNVIHGCNERCTYCVVPNTRGVEQSRAPDAIRVRAACPGPCAGARLCLRQAQGRLPGAGAFCRHGWARCMHACARPRCTESQSRPGKPEALL